MARWSNEVTTSSSFSLSRLTLWIIKLELLEIERLLGNWSVTWSFYKLTTLRVAYFDHSYIIWSILLNMIFSKDRLALLQPATQKLPLFNNIMFIVIGECLWSMVTVSGTGCNLWTQCTDKCPWTRTFRRYYGHLAVNWMFITQKLNFTDIWPWNTCL